MTDPAEKAVRTLWEALSVRDWDAVAASVSDDCLYADMPVGVTLAARGPVDIVKRLKVGLEPLAGYVNHDGVLVSNGTDVLYEHSETWTWASGETVLLEFVTVHQVTLGPDPKVSIWKDYWNYGQLVDAAPATWMEELMAADTSWIFDATGLM